MSAQGWNSIGLKVIDAVKDTVFLDPGFYAAKARLREAFPDADMVEVAESQITVVRGGIAATVNI